MAALVMHVRYLKTHVEERGWRGSRLKYACPECVTDPALKAFIRDNATSPACSFCGGLSDRATAAHVNRLIARIHARLLTEWDPIHDDSDRAHWSTCVSTEDVLRHLSDPIKSESLRRAVASKLIAKRWLPIDRESVEARREHDGGVVQAGIRWSSDWRSFTEYVKTQTRYFFLESWFIDFFNALNTAIRRLGLIREVTPDTRLFRARIHATSLVLKSAFEMGTPPVEAARFANRMSPAGVPMFYAADSVDAAVSEIVDPQRAVGKVATVVSFKAPVAIKVVDFTRLPPIPSLFDASDDTRRNCVRFLWDFVRDISLPIEKDGREHVDYVPSQIITEFVRVVVGDAFTGAYRRFINDNILDEQRDPSLFDRDRIDGIAYPSARTGFATCYALFARRCVDESWWNPDWKGTREDLNELILTMDESSMVRIDMDEWMSRR